MMRAFWIFALTFGAAGAWAMDIGRPNVVVSPARAVVVNPPEVLDPPTDEVVGHRPIWRGPTLIDSGVACESNLITNFFDLAMNVDGEAGLVWSKFDGNNANVWSTRYRPGAGWAAAQMIENVGDSAAGPLIAMSAGSHTFAAWRQGPHDIMASRYITQTGWGAAAILDGATWVLSVDIATNAEGYAVAIWQSNGIWAARYTPGSGWGSAQTVDGSDGTGPHVAMNASGGAYAVWTRSDESTGANLGVWASQYAPATNGWTAPVQLGAGINPQIAASESGSAIAVWVQGDPSGIWAARYTPGGGWGNGQLIGSSGAPGLGVGRPRVAMNAKGHAFVVWSQESSGNTYDIWARRYAPTWILDDWQPAQLLESSNASADSPQIALNTEGSAFAVWRQHDGTNQSIWASRFSPGGGWGAAARIENNAADARLPKVVMNSAGRAFAAWCQTGGTIWVNRYE